MADSYTTVTGLLTFAGKPRITPLVATLFNPFSLSEEVAPTKEPNARYVSVADEVNNIWWDGMAEHLEGYCLDMDIATSNEDTAEILLNAIARHHGADVGQVIANIDYENQVDLIDLVRFCRVIPDGNNIDSIRLMAGYNCTRPHLFEFGGWVAVESPRFGIDIGTHSLLNYAETIDRALVNSEELAAATISEVMDILIDGIADDEVSNRVRARLVERLNNGIVQQGGAAAAVSA